MEQEIKINLIAKEKEVTIRHGEAAKPLENRPPIPVNLNGTLPSIFEFLDKRIETGQFAIERSCLVVNREKVEMTLTINENDPYNKGCIRGKLAMHPAFKSFGINNADVVWTPASLGLFFKMNKTFFADKATNMKLVSELMNFNATINAKVERSVQGNGNTTDNFTQIVNSNLPPMFVLHIPIFKGMPAETLEVETFAKVNGREVSFILLSPEANATLEAIRDSVIDAELAKIRERCPALTIIEE